MNREIPAAAPHPLVDGGGDEHLIWESRADVIGLSPASVNLLALAQQAGVRPILVTDAVTVLTPAFAQVWRDGGGGWVVRGPDALREGFTGRSLDSVEALLSADPPRTADDLDATYGAPMPATALELTAVTSLRHRPTRAALLGGPLEGIAGATGTVISGWGVHEPAVTAWDRATLTEFARSRMPSESLIVATGDGVAGTLTVRRTAHGVEELTTASADLGAPSTVAFEALLDRIDAHLADLGVGMPLIGFVSVRPTGRPLQVTSTLPAPPSPLRLLIGPPGVKLLGVRPDELVARFGAERIGRPRLPGLLFRLGTLGEATWGRLDEILGSFDRTVLDDALRGSAGWRVAAPAGEGDADGR